MKYVITGTSGFLGQSLAERLVRAGHDVVLIGRTEAKKKQHGEFYKADITDLQSLEDCRQKIKNIDGVIHLAALVPKNKDEDQPENMFTVNARGTLNILEVFGTAAKNIVYASTAEVYGLPETNQPLSEDTTVPRPLSYYGASKLTGELFCEVYAQRHGISIASLRFTVLYGPGDRINRAIPNFVNKAMAGENLEVFGGEELRDYLHVSDAVEALYLAATKSPSGVFNIGTGEGISIKETAEAIVKAAHSASHVTVKARQKPAADIVLDVRKAEQAFGFIAKRRFPDLIDEQIEWHKNN